MAAADARAPLSRSRVVARGLVHAAQVVGLVVLLRAFAEFPWAAAAAPAILRAFAASFLAPQRICFVVANFIVVGLAMFYRRDAASFSPWFADPSGSPSSSGDAPEHPLLEFLSDSSSTLQTIAEAEPAGEEVFVDKEAVHVKTVRAQPPRRTMSDKTGGGAAGRTARAASPELRRAKSENGRRRQRRSAAAAAAAAADDAEAFRLVVEAFIAKQQTLFHREESMIVARAAAAAAAGGGGAGCGEDGPAIAGAAVAVN